MQHQTHLWPKYTDASFVARRTALVSFEHTKAYVRFVRFLRDDLWLDCCVYSGRYRLDYVEFLAGTQYQLSRGKLRLGKVSVTPRQLSHIQAHLAAYLMAAYGFTVREVKPTRVSWNAGREQRHNLLRKIAS